MWLTPHATGVLGTLPPCGVVTKDTGAGYLVPLEWTATRMIKDCDNKLPPWHKHYCYHCWINEWFQGLGWNYPNIQVSVSFYWLVSSDLLWLSTKINAMGYFDDIPTLFQVMAWCRHARHHYLNESILTKTSDAILCDLATMSLAPRLISE